MNIINKLSLKYLQNNKRKVIIIVLNIILSTMLLFTVSLGASTLKGHSVKNSINNSGPHHVIYKNLNYKVYENLLNDKKIKDITIIQNDKIITDNTTLNLILFNKDIDKYITLDSGKFPENNQEIIIPNASNYNLNDNINQYKVVGIYKYSNIFTDNNVLITKKDIQKNLNTNYLVTFKSSMNLYNEIYKKSDELGLEYTINSFGNRVYEQVDENHLLLQSLGQHQDIKIQISMYSIILVILLVISMFCIMTIKNAFEISLSERKKYFGTLRSIGTSQKQIFKIILFETLLLSIISIPIGLLLGYGFTNILVYIVNNMMKEINIFEYQIIIYPVYMFFAFIFIIITILYSAIKPAKNTSKISPIEVIKENKVYYIEKSKENYSLIKRIFGTEGELAYKNIKRNSLKYIIVVNSLLVSIILFITLSSFVNFLYSNWKSDENNEYDITIYTSNINSNYQVLNEIKNISEIDNINISKSVNFYLNINNNYLTKEAITQYNNGNNSNISILGLEKEQFEKLKKEINLTEDKPILYNHGVIFKNNQPIPTKWFNNDINEINICSNAIENTCYYTFKDFSILNKNIFNIEHYNPVFIVSMEWLDIFSEQYIKLYDHELVYEQSKNITIEIKSNKFIEVDRELNKIFDKYSTLELNNNYYNYSLDNYEEHITLSTIKLIINIVMIFIVIISITSIINTMNTNLLLRETEFSILRSIGLSKKGLNKMLLLDSVFLCIKSIIYGIPAATFFTLIMQYLSYLMTKELFKFPTESYLISFIGIIIIIFIMNTFSNNKIKNKNIIDSIKKNSI